MKNRINDPNHSSPRFRLRLRLFPFLAGAAMLTATAGYGAIPAVPPGLADLKVEKRVSEPEVDEGNPVVYEITVWNAGPDVATQVEVVDTMPQGLSLNHINATGSNCKVEGNRVICSLPQLDPQTSFSFQVVATPDVEGTLTNQVDVTGHEDDPDPGNNLARVPIRVFRRLDFGDAPDPTYPTLLGSNGARHRIIRGWRLGAAIDREPNGQPDATATGDDIAGLPDEDGVVFSTSIVSGAMSIVQVTSSTNGFLDAWIDFNADGVWNAAEQIFASQPLLAGVNILTFPVPAVPPAVTFSRFRLSHSGGLAPVGYALSGEVEDYRVRITTDRMDFGDAPNPYPTLSASNGARHRLSPLFLGVSIDSEPDGQPTGAADGDDLNGGPDDENGVAWSSALFTGKTASVGIIASGAGFLDAWIDFNRDGVWAAAEQIFVSVPVVAGVNPLTFAVPAGLSSGETYARFRLSSVGGLTPVGVSADGEVEDYRVRIQPSLRFVPLIPHRVNDVLVLTWDNQDALLEQSPTPKGPWQVVDDATSPYEVNPEPGHRTFYRLRLPIATSDFRSKLHRADLVFQGVVTGVAYRNSDVNERHPVSYPNTFVTFDVERVIKGTYDRETITLRFLGGATPDGRVMELSGSTHFDIGERSILFVRKNGRVAIPLVNGGEGRFRLIDGLVYAEDGRAVVWTKSASVGFEAGALPDEVAHDQVGGQTIERVRDLAGTGEGGPEGPGLATQQMTATSFREFLTDLDQSVDGRGGLVESLDIEEPFFIPQPTESQILAGPNINREVIQTERERLELEAYEANGGNPVLD